MQFVMIFPVQESCVLFDCTELFLFRRSSSVMKNGAEEPFFMPPSPRGKVFFQVFRHTETHLPTTAQRLTSCMAKHSKTSNSWMSL